MQRFNRQGSNAQRPAMVLDASGNVLVTGDSYGGDPASGGTQDDWVTLKYSGAGVPLWTNYYNGPGNTEDTPQALGVDASGNVFVTGVTLGPPGDPLLGATVKYSPDGVPVWTRQFESSPGRKALAVDASGNVLVACQNPWEGTHYDLLTMKYSSAGDLLWTNRYNGPGDTDEDPVAVATDAGGNVVVTGLSHPHSWAASNSVTIKYSSAGVQLWTSLQSMNVAALALDSSGDVVVTGYRASDYVPSDYATIKYSSAGVPLWTNYYNGPGNYSDYANAVGVDASGNVVVTGQSDGIGTSTAYATVKYSAAGVPLWTNRYDGPENGIDSARALAVDPSGNVFVTGSSAERSGTAYATVAYSSSGAPLWTNRYHGSGNYGDWASAIAVDASGGVYVTGVSGAGSGVAFYATIKYTPPPLIIARQPLSRTNAVGTIATFTVEAVGSLPLSYQWRRQGTNLVQCITID